MTSMACSETDNSGKHITVIESVNGKDSDVVVHLLRHF